MKQPPYLRRVIIQNVWEHNPKHDPDALCICNHPYYRHFDSYDDNAVIGCKYCSCRKFGATIEEWEEFNEQKLFCDPIELMKWDEKSRREIWTVDDFHALMKSEKEHYENGRVSIRFHAFPMKNGKAAELFNLTMYTRDEDYRFPFVPDAYLVIAHEYDQDHS